MKINTLEDLDKFEYKIGSKFKKFRLGDILHSLHIYGKTAEYPFIVAGVALFAIRFSLTSKNIQQKKGISSSDLHKLINLVWEYQSIDPIIFDNNLQTDFINSNPIFPFIRLVNQQFPFNISNYSQFTRPIFLYHEIPPTLVGKKGVPKFDLIKEFENLNGISVPEFINLMFVISSYLRQYSTFSLDDIIRQARSKGINIPDDQGISLAMSQIASDQKQLSSLYEKRQVGDRRFKMYDISPLLEFPIIYPCRGTGFIDYGNNIISAPVPDLIARRSSIGIYYQLFNNFTHIFPDYFGHVLENYLGIVLDNCITSEQIFNENQISSSYSGKKPDYAIIDGSMAILIECKAVKLKKDAKTMANEEAINESLKQIIKGLKQLNEFIEACQKNLPGLDKFDGCSKFKPVLVSLEKVYLINSDPFRNHINDLLRDEGIINLDWQILSIGELERLQPHLVEGIHLSEVLRDLEQKTFNDVLENLAAQTHKTYKDSFLYPKQEELYQRLGLPEEQ